MDFSPVKLAGIRPGEFARLAGVSRVTASQWLNAHKQPHHLLTERVADLLDLIAAAVEGNRLPVPDHVEREDRDLYIRSALAAQQ